MRPRNRVYALFAMLALSGANAADCGREDIAFYLEEGFTPEQITRMCSTAMTGEEAAGQNTGDLRSLDPPDPADSGDPATYLALAIDSDAVFVDDDRISFRHTVCAERGRVETCPDITLEVDLRGLQITDTGRGADGESALEVQGNIQRQINNYEALTPAGRQVVDRLYTERRAQIPIREGVSAEQAGRALRLLVENANPPLIVSE